MGRGNRWKPHLFLREQVEKSSGSERGVGLNSRRRCRSGGGVGMEESGGQDVSVWTGVGGQVYWRAGGGGVATLTQDDLTLTPNVYARTQTLGLCTLHGASKSGTVLYVQVQKFNVTRTTARRRASAQPIIFPLNSLPGSLPGSSIFNNA